MNGEMTTIGWPPPWIPASGHQLRKAGTHFDAVRVAPRRGLQAARFLQEATAGEPGPVVRTEVGFRWTYFLLPPGEAGTLTWPAGTTRFTAATHNAYVGIPALRGDTWPLVWWSEPTPQRPFVDTGLLLKALEEFVGWEPL